MQVSLNLRNYKTPEIENQIPDIKNPRYPKPLDNPNSNINLALT